MTESVTYYLVEGLTGSGTWFRFDKTPSENLANRLFDNWTAARPGMSFRLRKQTINTDTIRELKR